MTVNCNCKSYAINMIFTSRPLPHSVVTKDYSLVLIGPFTAYTHLRVGLNSSCCSGSQKLDMLLFPPGFARTRLNCCKYLPHYKCTDDMHLLGFTVDVKLIPDGSSSSSGLET